MVTFSAFVVGLFGLVLFGGGVQLVVLGGSAYYLLAGGGMLITALLLHRRSVDALTVYAAVLFATLIWALWEVGPDWWQLGPRGGVIVLIGLWLLMPFVRRRLDRSTTSPRLNGTPALALVGACLLSVVVAGWSLFTDPQDLAGQLPEKTTGRQQTRTVACLTPSGGSMGGHRSASAIHRLPGSTSTTSMTSGKHGVTRRAT